MPRGDGPGEVGLTAVHASHLGRRRRAPKAVATVRPPSSGEIISLSSQASASTTLMPVTGRRVDPWVFVFPLGS
jgi:hypothetical protein